MAKKAFKCTACGHVVNVWTPQCEKCEAFSTLDRDDSATVSSGGGASGNSGGMLPGKIGARASRAASGRAPQRINDIKSEDYARFSTGIAEFDRVLGGGLVPGGVILLAGAPGAGKALSLDTELVTPDGWTTMGEVSVGDFLIGDNGLPTKVVAATEVMLDRPTYRVEFTDGSSIVADREHQWVTSTAESRNLFGAAAETQIRTTKELLDTLIIEGAGLNHAIQTTLPIQFQEKDLAVHPFDLGAWLKNDRNAKTLEGDLRKIGVLDNRHIPVEYLRSSLEQRKALLAGLVGTSHLNHHGVVQLLLANERLAKDAYELVVSVGYKAFRASSDADETTGKPSCYLVSFLAPHPMFDGNQSLIPSAEYLRSEIRYIENVVQIPSVPVRCVEVDNESHMYLAGESMIPTHNSTLALGAAKTLSDQGKKVLIISGEETEAQIASRAKRINALSDNLYLLSEGNLTNALSHISSLNPDVVIVDSMQTLVSSNSEGRVGSPAQVAEVASDLTQLAKALNIPTLLIGHITKDGNIAGPRVVEHLVDVVLYFEGSKDSGLRLLRGVKNRYGAVDEIGCFEHTEEGLVEVTDPSGFFLSEHENGVTGYATSILIEGNRALPIEIQALVTPTALPNPRKISHGLDHSRVMMIQAILEKHGRLRLSDKDVYVSTTGGLLTKDSSIDLAIAAAIISSVKSLELPEHSVFLGETSLTGEIRPPREMRKRVGEAERLGFNTIIMPRAEDGKNAVKNIKNLIFRLEENQRNAQSASDASNG